MIISKFFKNDSQIKMTLILLGVWGWPLFWLTLKNYEQDRPAEVGILFGG